MNYITATSNDNKEEAGEGTLSSSQFHEPMLLIPPRLCQSAYALLVRNACAARPWHLQGRFGSRTRRSSQDGDKRMALPVLYGSCKELWKHSSSAADEELRVLLIETDNVEVVYQPFVPSNRAHTLPAIDARIHPERAPTTKDESSTSSFCKKRKLDEASCTPSSVQPSDSDAAVSEPLFTYAELFAGIGGFGVALDALGGQCVFCSELESACRAVYAQNNNNNNHDNFDLHGDIYKVPDEAISSIGKVDLLVGGFPCQPFSSLGQQPGLEDPKGALFLQIVRFLQIAKPRAFLLENVPGLLQMTDTFQTIVTALEKSGYQVTTEVCNARGLTATNRKRLFFVGLLKKQSCGDGDGSNVDIPPFEFPYIPDLSLRAIDVVNYSNTELTEDELQLLTLTDAQLKQLTEGNRKWKPGASMAWPNVVCDTIIAHYGNAVGRGGSQLVPTAAPANPRRFSPRECARIMGFPNSFRLNDIGADTASNSKTQTEQNQQGNMACIKEQYRMLGNAVCPPLMAAIAGAVLAHCTEIQGYRHHTDWVKWGRETAVRIALSATLPNDGHVKKKKICAASIPPSFGHDRKLDLTL